LSITSRWFILTLAFYQNFNKIFVSNHLKHNLLEFDWIERLISYCSYDDVGVGKWSLTRWFSHCLDFSSILQPKLWHFPDQSSEMSTITLSSLSLYLISLSYFHHMEIALLCTWITTLKYLYRLAISWLWTRLITFTMRLGYRNSQ
jgi:hypothetical protein